MKAIEPRVITSQYLTFFVGDEEYAAPLLQVREVVEALPITRVPSMPPAIRGLVNLRGSVVPVVDLGVRLGIAERAVTKRTCIVVIEVDIEGETTVMGLLVDAVSQVIDLRLDTIEPVPPFGTHGRVELLRGIGVVGSRFVLLLDIDGVLSPAELLVAAALPEAAVSPADKTPPALEGA